MKPATSLLVLLFLAVGLAACGQPPASAPIPTPTSTPIPESTATLTGTPSPTPEPAWMATVKTQDSDGHSINIVDGKPTIDLYDTTTTQESIFLTPESITVKQTTDVLYPNILTAKDADGNQYIFNPDVQGWFKVPEVQMDYTKLELYTPVTVDYFTDGRFALVSALKYAENPTISPNAPIPQFWANSNNAEPSYNGNSNFVDISMNPHGELGLAQRKWSDLIKYYTAENKPFAWTGFYKVYYNDGADYFYVIGRTTKTDVNQTQGLAYGFDKLEYERRANSLTGDNVTTELQLIFQGVDGGGKDLMMILAPTNDSQFLWNPDLAKYGFAQNPVVAALQQRGELISLFNPEDQQIILDVLNQIQIEYAPGATTPLQTSPLNSLPPNLSKYILLPGRG